MKKLDQDQPSLRWVYLIIGIIIMMSLGTVYSWSVFRLPLEKVYDIGSTQSGLPYTVSLAFYALFMFLTGKYIDKYSPKRIIFIGTFLVSIGWILSAFAPNIIVLTITYGCIIGAGVGIAYGVPMTVIAKWFPEKKGLAVGIVLLGFGLSPLITAPLARILIDLHGIKSTFLVLGLTFGVLLPILSLPLKYPDKTYNKSQKTLQKTTVKLREMDTSKMLKSKDFKGLYVCFMLGTMIGLMIIGITSSVGVELIRLSPQEVTIYISIFAIFNGIGRPSFGWIADKLSSKKAILISFGLIMFGALLMLLAKNESILVFIVAFSIFWFNLGGWLSIAPTLTLKMYGLRNYSQNYGVVFTAYGIGATFGGVGSGILLDFTQNYYSLFYFVIGLCVLGIVIAQKTIKV